MANDLYRSGLTDFLSVLDAERTVHLAEEEEAQSERANSLAMVALAKALGGGWEAQGP